MARGLRARRFQDAAEGNHVDTDLDFVITTTATITNNSTETVATSADTRLDGLTNTNCIINATLLIDNAADLTNGPVELDHIYLNDSANTIQARVTNSDGSSNDIDVTIQYHVQKIGS
jgi:hypothetical protein